MVEDSSLSPDSSVQQKIRIGSPNKTLMQNGSSKRTSKIDQDHSDQNAPPDGGTRAWMVMLGSFFCNGILFGIINSYSVFYDDIYLGLERRNVTNAPGKASLVGSFAMGTTFFISPVSGVLTDYMGIRTTTFIGGAIASSGMFAASFCVDQITALCITYGVMFGLGGALAYTPSLAVLGHYFKRRLGLVNGIVTAGSSAFTIVMPYLMDGCLKAFGLVWTLRVLAVIISFIMVCAILFKPIKTQGIRISKKVSFKDVFNVTLLKNTKYLIWTAVIAISLFGYFIPYVYIKKFVESNFDDISEASNKLPILCIGIMSGVGRLSCGLIADRPGVSKILVQQISFLVLGILTMLLPLTRGHFSWLVVICLGMGIVDGCFISVLGPIAFELCGRDAATQAIGFLLGVASIPLIIGPYIAGIIYDHEQDFTLPFILAGIPPTLGAVAMFAIKCVKNKRGQGRNLEVFSAVQEPLNKSSNGCLSEPAPGGQEEAVDPVT